MYYITSTRTEGSSIAKAAALLGHELKNEQEESVFQFASGKDVFVCLPTGYGKSLAMKSCPSIDSVDIKYAILWAYKLHSTATKGCMEGDPSVCVLVM